VCGGGAGCRVLVDRERGDALLLAFGYFVAYGEDRPDAHVTGRETAASHQECGELDSTGSLLRHLAMSKFLSSRGAGRASDT
jgi:hypothetical protein